VCIAIATWPCTAVAAPVMIPLDGEEDLLAEGFEHHPGSGTSTFADGMMTVDTVGYEEWILFAPTPSKWWDEVLPEKGWWIEVRVRIDDADPGCPDVGPGLWIHDRGKLIKIQFGPDHVQSYPTGVTAPFDTSSFHVYRVEDFGDGTRHLLADGNVLLDLAGDGGGGTPALTFGDLGGCGHSRAVWDYYAYDTFAPGAEDEDNDGDGIPNAEDDCFEVADPEQLDTDQDGRGDVCDACPLDALDDRDGDGACDSDDACPDDASTTEEPCPLLDTGFEVGPWDEEGGEFGSDSLDGGTVTAEGGSLSQGGTDSADGGSLEGATGIDDSTDDGCACTTDRGRTLPWLGMFVLLGLNVSRRARRATPAPRPGWRGGLRRLRDRRRGPGERGRSPVATRDPRRRVIARA
jgi:hypothetical protein